MTDELKIELGPGDHPWAGYLHVDKRHGLPCQEVQADLLALPFKDCCADEVFSVQVLEHIDWKVVPEMLAETHRVLKVGGMFRCCTVDIFGLASMIVRKELPIRTALNYVYGGGGYEENWHKGAFTVDYMRELLEGLKFDIETLSSRVEHEHRATTFEQILVEARKK